MNTIKNWIGCLLGVHKYEVVVIYETVILKRKFVRKDYQCKYCGKYHKFSPY